jgi:phosphoribosylamine---glycine ligase
LSSLNSGNKFSNYYMNILLIGSGGREHTMAWKIKQSPLCSKLFIAPGNAGTAGVGVNINIGVNDFAAQEKLCREHDIHMVVVGPEEPLVKGIQDYFIHAHTNNPFAAGWYGVIGPSSKAAQLEGSKAFAKAFMQRHGIPTAAYREFNAQNYTEGIDYIRKHSVPIVLKADGLAAGKGVLICSNPVEALAEFELMVQQDKFGEAGRNVVIEEFLEGIEMSVFVLTDGKNYTILPEAKDYKRVGDGDSGLNTGGMGAVSPVPFADAALMEKIRTAIIEPTIAGLQKDQLDYRGFIFIGLMCHNGEPKVIEYNCRMGDPETEVVIPRIQNDFCEMLQAAATQKVDTITLTTDKRAAVAVMAVSGGYPGDYKKGYDIAGLDKPAIEGTMLFHAGTQLHNDKVLTSGGRVIAVTSFGETIGEAAEQSLYAIEQIYFEDIYFRSDIGFEFRKKQTNVNE